MYFLKTIDIRKNCKDFCDDVLVMNKMMTMVYLIKPGATKLDEFFLGLPYNL